MRARIWTAAALLALAAPVVAQDAAELSVADAIAEVMKDYETKYDDFVAAYRAADGEEARQKVVDEQYPNSADWFPQLWEAVDRAPADPACVEALVWIARNDRSGEHSARSGELLLAHHVADEALGDACWTFVRAKNGSAFLELVMEKSPHADVRAVAKYNLAKSLLNEDSEANAQIADELFSQVELNHADVEHPYRGTLGKAAAADLYELRNLSIGMQVPEIEGEDLDGVPFKLSDYQGKVILLDFWGNW